MAKWGNGTHAHHSLLHEVGGGHIQHLVLHGVVSVRRACEHQRLRELHAFLGSGEADQLSLDEIARGEFDLARLRERGLKLRRPDRGFATPDHYVLSSSRQVADIPDPQHRSLVEQIRTKHGPVALKTQSGWHLARQSSTWMRELESADTLLGLGRSRTAADLQTELRLMSVRGFPPRFARGRNDGGGNETSSRNIVHAIQNDRKRATTFQPSLRGAEGDAAIQKNRDVLFSGYWIASLRSQ